MSAHAEPREPIVVPPGQDDCEVCGDHPGTLAQPFSPQCSWDCWQRIHCECCGAHVDTGCSCEIRTDDGYSSETGPYTDTYCATHGGRI